MTEVERLVLRLIAKLVLEVRDEYMDITVRDDLRRALQALEHEGSAMRRAIDVLSRG